VWAFDRFTDILEYKAKIEGIELVGSERERHEQDDSQRVERGLYVCESCDAAFNVSVDGARNIRLTITEESNSESVPDSGGERSPGSAGWHSQESTYTSCPCDSNRRTKW
jgi:hypothetical protein